jgi:hypothetical protein
MQGKVLFNDQAPIEKKELLASIASAVMEREEEAETGLTDAIGHDMTERYSCDN